MHKADVIGMGQNMVEGEKYMLAKLYGKKIGQWD
jgi:hypothetical protein